MKISKVILTSIVGTLLLASCTNQPQPFNRNIKTIVFLNGKAFHIPQGADYKLSTVNMNDVTLFKALGISTCNEGDLFWKSDLKNIIVPGNGSAHIMIGRAIQNKKYDHITFADMKVDIQRKSDRPKDSKVLLDNLSNMVSDETTFSEMRDNKEVVSYLWHGGMVSFYSLGIKKGIAGCVSEMSNNEFQYYSNKSNLDTQLRSDQNIQNQKSLDKSLDRLNNNTPKTYNVNMYHN